MRFWLRFIGMLLTLFGFGMVGIVYYMAVLQVPVYLSWQWASVWYACAFIGPAILYSNLCPNSDAGRGG